MKKPLKTDKNKRIAAYFDRDSAEWLKEKADAIGVKEGVFLRILVKNRMMEAIND